MLCPPHRITLAIALATSLAPATALAQPTMPQVPPAPVTSGAAPPSTPAPSQPPLSQPAPSHAAPGATTPSASITAAPAPTAPIEAPEHHVDAPFRLMSTGITVGVGGVLHMGRAFPNRRASQDGLSLAFMPYFVLTPAYWFGSHDKACAVHGAASAEKQRRAFESDGITSPLRECFAYKFGLYVGKPLTYQATTTVARDGASQGLRDVTSIVSVGVAYSPSAALSVMLGITPAEVHRDDGSSATVALPALSLGINLDALLSPF